MQTVAKRLQDVRRIKLNDPIFIKLGVSFAFWVQRPYEQFVILTRGPRDEPVREVDFTLGEQIIIKNIVASKQYDSVTYSDEKDQNIRKQQKYKTLNLQSRPKVEY